MKTLTPKPIVLALMLAGFALSLFVTPSTAEAGWKSHYDELPGLSDFDLTPYLVVGGALIAGAIIYKIATHQSGDTEDLDDLVIPDTEEEVSAEEPAVDDQDVLETESDTETAAALRLTPPDQSRLGLFLDVTDDTRFYGPQKDAFDFSDLTVKAGVTIGF